MRQRLWMDPTPPRRLREDLPEWFQEVVLRCLAPEAAKRYPSAAMFLRILVTWWLGPILLFLDK
jgi:hypothetical protein